MLYPFIRQSLFLLPPETAHKLSMQGLHMAAGIPILKKKLASQFQYSKGDLSTSLWGLQFPNPVGLGAGFDKNAAHLDELEMLGFGFVEIGTVTPKPQAGNLQPRLFRIPDQKALINRMGFNNEGLEIIASRLKDRKAKANSNLIIGGNIGKNKVTDNHDAWIDYCTNFKGLESVVDYFVVNVSSPNTPGLRALQEKESLRKIFSELQNLNKNNKPILLKMAPDLEWSALDDIIELCSEIKIDGLVATNTTIDRSLLIGLNVERAEKIGPGGLSGKPLFTKSNEVLSYLNKGVQGRIPIIASGGIFNGEEAHEKMKSGASLIQIWTGFIYEGPSIVKNICTYLSTQK
ncbi:MAG: quinone-dependent dihydroorotate dehydrogenase [Bacteroidetes bacterium]|nr:quinone-dependent dihydroorotate dehydrogenase [Bacteroidota bacterium]